MINYKNDVNRVGKLFVVVLLFLLSFMFHSGTAKVVNAATCDIKLFWIVNGVEKDATQALSNGGNTIPAGTTYQAKVVFTDCNNPSSNVGTLSLVRPNKTDTIQVVINNTPKVATANITFDSVGEYGFYAGVTSASGSTIKDSATTLPIKVTDPVTTPPGGPTPTPTLDPNGGGGTVGTITNPISYQSLGALIVGLIKFLMTMLGALAVLFIIIGAVRMVASAGNESEVKAGKSTVTWAVVGLATALLAFSIISMLQSVLGRN